MNVISSTLLGAETTILAAGTLAGQAALLGTPLQTAKNPLPPRGGACPSPTPPVTSALWNSPGHVALTRAGTSSGRVPALMAAAGALFTASSAQAKTWAERQQGPSLPWNLEVAHWLQFDPLGSAVAQSVVVLGAAALVSSLAIAAKRKFFSGTAQLAQARDTAGGGAATEPADMEGVTQFAGPLAAHFRTVNSKTGQITLPNSTIIETNRPELGGLPSITRVELDGQSKLQLIYGKADEAARITIIALGEGKFTLEVHDPRRSDETTDPGLEIESTQLADRLEHAISELARNAAIADFTLEELEEVWHRAKTAISLATNNELTSEDADTLLSSLTTLEIKYSNQGTWHLAEKRWNEIEAFIHEKTEVSELELDDDDTVLTATPPALATFAQSTIFDKANQGAPEDDPTESRMDVRETPRATVAGVISYGGLGSRCATYNEDSKFLVYRGGDDGDGTLFLGVIDGAGGQGNGYAFSVDANQRMVNALQAVGKDAYTAIKEINPDLTEKFKQIVDTQPAPPDGKRKYPAATTAVASISPSREITLTAVGDAQATVLRNGVVIEETELQNQPAVFLRRGVDGVTKNDIYTHATKSIVLNALGKSFESRTDVHTSIKTIPGKAGDYVVTYSDGVTDVISPYELALWSKQFPDPKDLAEKILKEAKERNTNASGNVAEIEGVDDEGKTVATFEIEIEVAAGESIKAKRAKNDGDNISVQVARVK